MGPEGRSEYCALYPVNIMHGKLLKYFKREIRFGDYKDFCSGNMESRLEQTKMDFGKKWLGNASKRQWELKLK